MSQVAHVFHTPTPYPQDDEEDPDSNQPAVPPDQQQDVVPVQEPANPGEHSPMIGIRP